MALSHLNLSNRDKYTPEKQAAKAKAMCNKVSEDKMPPKKFNEDKINLQGYPIYPASEDIYSKFQEEKDINPEDISKTKELNDIDGTNNEKDFNDDISGSDLDIPGSELDDKQENVGSEDEENNFYSLGGDDHND